MRCPGLSASLVRLAALLGEVLGGPLVPAAQIDETLIALALRRHFVGPLFYAAVSNGRHVVAPESLQRLEQCYRANAAKQVLALTRLHRVADEFRVRGINWMAFKGVMQAAQLYTDPVWRESADIDILVTPGEFRRALEALMDMGYIASNPPMRIPHVLRLPLLSMVRDVGFVARDDHSCAVELHQRLFFANDRCTQSVGLRALQGPIPTPEVDHELALYLIMHGAACFWVRLKWLLDLVPLFAKLDNDELVALMVGARRAGVEKSLAASLLLLQSLFPFVVFGPLSSWLLQMKAEPAVQQRLFRYMEMLNQDSDWKSSPLDNAFQRQRAYWLLFEAPSARLQLLRVPLLAVVRRIAWSFNKADRALTLSDTPP